MHKVTSAAVGIAMLASTGLAFADTASSTTAMHGEMTKKTVNIQCVQTAVDAREQAVGDAFTAFSSAMTSALAARKTALHDAWGMTDATARAAARKAAWKAYNDAAKKAHATLKTARNTAWSTAKTAVKACGSTMQEERSADGNGVLGL